jgi:glycerophosphoryl diester phosphodiesterase
MKKYPFAIIALLTVMLFPFLSCRTKKINASITPPQKKVIITGHRGAGGLAAENSLNAIHTGILLKADRIEIDVHQTKDSVIVVMHDESVDRTTNCKGRIKNKTWQEIAGCSLKPFEADSSEQKIPTLDDVLQAINGKAILVIELKQGGAFYPGIEEQVIALIRKHHAEKWCIIHSFKENILARVHELAPDIPLHLLVLNGLWGRKIPDYIQEVSAFNQLLTKKFIDKMHELGKKVNVWTVNSKKEMSYCIYLGVDGIITDYPDIAIAELNTNHQQ